MIKETTPNGEIFWVIGIHELDNAAKLTQQNILVHAKNIQELDDETCLELREISRGAKKFALVLSEETKISLGVMMENVPMLGVAFFTFAKAEVYFDKPKQTNPYS